MTKVTSLGILLLWSLAGTAVGRCPELHEVQDSLPLIARTKDHFDFDNLPGRDSLLRPGLRFEAAGDPLAGAWTVEYEEILVGCTSTGGITDHVLEMNAGTGRVQVRIVVAQASSADAHEIAILKAAFDQRGPSAWVLGSEVGIGLGDWSLVQTVDNGDANFVFVRNNIAVTLRVTLGDPVTQDQLLELAGRLDALIVAKPEYADLADSGLLPVVNDFRLDLPPGTLPERGVEIPIILDAVDPAGEELTFHMVVEKPGRATGIGAINRVQDSPPEHAFRGYVAGEQEIDLFAVNESGLMSRATLPIEVERKEGQPVAIAKRAAAIVECDPAGTVITLDGSDSFDPDGTIVKYSWRGTGEIADPTAAVTTMTLGAEGLHSAALTVVDDVNNFDQDRFTVESVDTTPPDIHVALVPLEPVVLAPAECKAPTSRLFRVTCADLVDCDHRAEFSTQLVVMHHDVPSRGECVSRFDEIPVACDETVMVRLLPQTCPARPASPRSSLSVDSTGLKHVQGEQVVLQALTVDSWDNQGVVAFDPAVEPSALCDVVLPDGTCCPALAQPRARRCRVTPCGVPDPPNSRR